MTTQVQTEHLRHSLLFSFQVEVKKKKNKRQEHLGEPPRSVCMKSRTRKAYKPPFAEKDLYKQKQIC